MPNTQEAVKAAKEHTPGPWEPGGQAVSGITQGLIKIEGSEVVHISGQEYMTGNGRMSTKSASHIVAYLNGDPGVSKAAAANLALICQAPILRTQRDELAEALVWALEYGTFDVAEDNPLHARMLTKAQAALAQVEETNA